MTQGQRLYQMIFGYPVSQIITTAVRLGVPDSLGAGMVATDVLAAAAGADVLSLRRLLAALAELGLVREAGPDHFQLTDQGRLLRSDVPGSVCGPALLAGHPVMWQAWGALEQTVRSGSPGFELVFGKPLFDYLADHRELGELFNSVLAARTRTVIPELVAKFDFSGCGRIMDVGGGDGTTLAAILRANPELTGVLFDTSEVVGQALPVLAAAGLAQRCMTEAGDFLRSVPAGCDTYVLKNILHDWNDEQATTILGNCRRAVPVGGRLLVMTLLRPQHPDPASGMGTAISDIEMMLLTTGRERTLDDYRALFEAAGFQLGNAHLVTQYPDYYVIQAHPV